MKSIQDLVIYLNSVGAELQVERLSIEILDTKDFIIWDVTGDEPQCLFNSQDSLEAPDINDLPYIPIVVLCKEIRDNISVKDIRAEDL